MVKYDNKSEFFNNYDEIENVFISIYTGRPNIIHHVCANNNKEYKKSTQQQQTRLAAVLFSVVLSLLCE